ncbi:uncharacterized protein LOC120509679 isoform X4 [Passer montanus]|uniref:uncharacterized protein LOC120509679 isoform X4 n=1 Tax=Passer montanus TaxID=9160 RepID=UPI0019602920|nr:uncharacterized protein LOC120509679 isoform X4 [Passer montanus]
MSLFVGGPSLGLFVALPRNPSRRGGAEPPFAAGEASGVPGVRAEHPAAPVPGVSVGSWQWKCRGKVRIPLTPFPGGGTPAGAQSGRFLLLPSGGSGGCCPCLGRLSRCRRRRSRVREFCVRSRFPKSGGDGANPAAASGMTWPAGSLLPAVLVSIVTVTSYSTPIQIR